MEIRTVKRKLNPMKKLKPSTVGYAIFGIFLSKLIELRDFFLREDFKHYHYIDIVQAEVLENTETYFKVRVMSDKFPERKFHCINFYLKQSIYGSYCEGYVVSTKKKVYFPLHKRVRKFSKELLQELERAFIVVGMKIER